MCVVTEQAIDVLIDLWIGFELLCLFPVRKRLNLVSIWAEFPSGGLDCSPTNRRESKTEESQGLNCIATSRKTRGEESEEEDKPSKANGYWTDGGVLAVVWGQVMVHGTYSYHHRADLLSTMFQIPLMIHRSQREHETKLPASSFSFSAWNIAQTFGFYIVVNCNWWTSLEDWKHGWFDSLSRFTLHHRTHKYICNSLGLIANDGSTVL